MRNQRIAETPRHKGKRQISPETNPEFVRRAIREGDFLKLYFRELDRFPPLTPEEIRELARLVAKNRNLAARNAIVEHNLRFVAMIARRYLNRGLEYEDLVQEGSIGLIIAANRFDSRGAKFLSFAVWWIRQKITRALYCARVVRVPEHVLVPWRKICRASARIVQEVEREPTPEEIAKVAGLPLAEVKKVLRHMKVTTVRLDDLAFNDQKLKPGPERRWAEIVADRSKLAPDGILEAKEEFLAACRRMQQLLATVSFSCSERERAIFVRRYGLDDSFEGETLEEIGFVFDVSRERIRQLLERIWDRLELQGFEGREVWLLSELKRIQELEDLTGEVAEFK